MSASKKRGFYTEFEQQDTKALTTTVVIQENENQSNKNIPVKELTSEIVSNQALLEKFSKLRKLIDYQYHYIYYEYHNLKSALKNEGQNVSNSIQMNIINGNEFEINEKLVPSICYSLTAFYTGRIITNPNNWNSIFFKQNIKSVSAKLLTSFPSRILLPFIFAGVIFAKETPKTFDNVATYAMKRNKDELSFVGSCKKWRSEIEQKCSTLEKDIDLKLQQNIHSLRKFIMESI